MKGRIQESIACGVVSALLAAVVVAPLFHFHAGDEHGPGLIHAHLPELETDAAELVVHMEAPHGHGESRPIDVFLATSAHSLHLDLVVTSFPVALNRVEVCCGFVSVASPKAHAPPVASSNIPRSPPADIPFIV